MPKHALMELPYAENALEPYISAETISYHYGKHHATYVNKLNGLVEGTQLENASLEELIRSTDGAVFNNAAQIWNHDFYWNCLGPARDAKPSAALGSAIDEFFGDFASFKDAFNASALDNFGSGWTWLVKSPSGALEIVNTDDAQNPMTEGYEPLLVCDVWEHAYYIDYRNGRATYLESFWNLVNWEFVDRNHGAG